MFHKTSSTAVITLLAANLVQVSTAIPNVTPTTTITVSGCPLGTCTKICVTPTVTLDPTKIEGCTFDHQACPIAKCIPIPPVISTSTSYCKNTCTFLTTTGCEKLPAATVIPPCPTKCPGLCPIPVETVAVACPTTIKVA